VLFILTILSKSKIGFSLFSILLIWQYGQYPGSRFPNWDYAWSDAMNISRLIELQQGVRNFNIPTMNYFGGLGIEKISEVAAYINPANPLHLLLFLDITPAQYMLIKTFLFLTILQIGTFKLIYSKTAMKRLAIITALIAATLPAYWSIIYPFSTMYCFICSVPLIIYFYTKYTEKNQVKYLFYYFILIIIIGPDLLTTGNIVIITVALSWNSFASKEKKLLQLKKFLSFSSTGVVATFSFWYPYLLLTLNRSERLEELGISSEAKFNFIQYWKMILLNGAHTLLYPIEASAIQMYVPLFCITTIVIFLFSKNQYSAPKVLEIKKLLLLTSTVAVIPSLLYLHPITSKYLASFFRNNFNVLPILLLLVSSLIWSEMSSKRFTQVIIISMGIELLLYIFDPFARFKNFIPNGDIIEQTLGTNHPLVGSNLADTLKITMPFFVSNPWLTLIAANLLTALVVKSTTKNDGLRQKEIFLFISVSLIFFSFSTGVELRKYMNNWQQISVSDYRFSNYEKRINHWIDKYQINDDNYRVLLAGKDFYKNSGRNLKIALDSELGSMYGIKTIPQYREFDNIDMGLSLFKTACQNCSFTKGESLGANFPLTTQQLLANPNFVSKNSVKYVVTADEEINSANFILLERYQYPFIAYSYDETENGVLYLYEFKNAKPIITSTGTENGINDVKITSEGINFAYASKRSSVVEINYYYNEGFFGTYQGQEIEILKTPDYKMEILMPPGKGTLQLRFHNSNFTDSIIVLFFVGGLFFFIEIRKRLPINHFHQKIKFKKFF
jgi:hypothetical protein